MKVKVYFDNAEERYKIYNGDTVINATEVTINEIPIDEQLSDTSANAVENRAVKKALDDNKSYSQEIVGSLNEKVDANKSDTDNKVGTLNSRLDEVIGQGMRLIKGTDISWTWGPPNYGISSGFQLPANTVIFVAIPKNCYASVKLNNTQAVAIYEFGNLEATDTQVGIFVTGENITDEDTFYIGVDVASDVTTEVIPLVEANTTLFIADSPQELKDIRVDYYGTIHDTAGDSVRYGMQLQKQTQDELEDVRVDAYGFEWSSAGDSVRSILKAIEKGYLDINKVISWSEQESSTYTGSAQTTINLPLNRTINITLPAETTITFEYGQDTTITLGDITATEVQEVEFTTDSVIIEYTISVNSNSLTYDNLITAIALNMEVIIAGGGTIDTEMSDESENAVQNKVIKSYVDTGLDTKASKDYITVSSEKFVALLTSSSTLLPSINTENKTLTIYGDTLLLMRTSPYYKQLSASTTVIDYSSVSSSAIKILYNVSTSLFRAVTYNTSLNDNEVLIATIRQANSSKYSIAMACPYYANGKLYGLVETDIANIKANYNLNVNSINHRGFNTVAPENTLPAFKLSRQKGFNIVETDVRFTSDNVPILLHDSSINRTARNSDGTVIENTINISDITYEQALAYDFGVWKSAEYTGTKIPTFEQFLILCRNLGFSPYIELKVGSQSQIEGLVDMVKNCGMTGKVTWISYGTTLLSYVKNCYPKARLGLIASSVTSTVINDATNLKTIDNEVFINSYTYTDAEITLCKNANIPLEVWTIDNSNLVPTLDPYITGITSNHIIAGANLYNNNIN